MEEWCVRLLTTSMSVYLADGGQDDHDEPYKRCSREANISSPAGRVVGVSRSACRELKLQLCSGHGCKFFRRVVESKRTPSRAGLTVGVVDRSAGHAPDASSTVLTVVAGTKVPLGPGQNCLEDVTSAKQGEDASDCTRVACMTYLRFRCHTGSAFIHAHCS